MPQTSKISKNNTKIIRNENGIYVILHSTEIVKVDYSTGSIILNTGGWKTATTKLRMNQVSNELELGYSVLQKKGNWYVNYKGIEYPFFDDTITFLILK